MRGPMLAVRVLDTTNDRNAGEDEPRQAAEVLDGDGNVLGWLPLVRSTIGVEAQATPTLVLELAVERVEARSMEPRR